MILQQMLMGPFILALIPPISTGTFFHSLPPRFLVNIYCQGKQKVDETDSTRNHFYQNRGLSWCHMPWYLYSKIRGCMTIWCLFLICTFLRLFLFVLCIVHPENIFGWGHLPGQDVNPHFTCLYLADSRMGLSTVFFIFQYEYFDYGRYEVLKMEICQTLRQPEYQVDFFPFKQS